MKRILLIIVLSLFLVPFVVRAEACGSLNDYMCTGSESTCKSKLSGYNTWSKSGISGTVCLKVLTKRSNSSNSSTFLSGYDPNNVTCADGSTPQVTFRNANPARENELDECSDGNCFVPELWEVTCGGTNTSAGNSSGNYSSGDSSSGNSSEVNSGNSNGYTNSNNETNGGDSTNSDGQITGTKDSPETGIRTYFVVLVSLAVVSYVILLISKRKNLFKNI